MCHRISTIIKCFCFHNFVLLHHLKQITDNFLLQISIIRCSVKSNQNRFISSLQRCLQISTKTFLFINVPLAHNRLQNLSGLRRFHYKSTYGNFFKTICKSLQNIKSYFFDVAWSPKTQRLRNWLKKDIMPRTKNKKINKLLLVQYSICYMLICLLQTVLLVVTQNATKPVKIVVLHCQTFRFCSLDRLLTHKLIRITKISHWCLFIHLHCKR